ncbi:C1q-like domain-containing protein [Halorussus caseinilyticus]|uniref:C1q domain-containing protein n=1 Tax=Halorussus caseinilyticus TaxID=3034025 RepID=A0ABD5WLA5_9EURY|nr:hypothetical protein [Halorussus sp. DT72]
MVKGNHDNSDVTKLSRRSLMALGAALAGSAGVTAFSGTASAHNLMEFRDAYVGDDAEKSGLGSRGWLFFAEDTGKIYKHNGSEWIETGIGSSASETTHSTTSVYLSSDQSIAKSTHEIVQFDTVEWDELNAFDTTANEFVAPTAGTYKIKTSVTYNSLGGDHVVTIIEINGEDYEARWSTTPKGDWESVPVSTIARLSKGDSVTITAWNQDNDDTLVGERLRTNLQIEQIN